MRRRQHIGGGSDGGGDGGGGERGVGEGVAVRAVARPDNEPRATPAAPRPRLATSFRAAPTNGGEPPTPTRCDGPPSSSGTPSSAEPSADLSPRLPPLEQTLQATLPLSAAGICHAVVMWLQVSTGGGGDGEDRPCDVHKKAVWLFTRPSQLAVGAVISASVSIAHLEADSRELRDTLRGCAIRWSFAISGTSS